MTAFLKLTCMFLDLYMWRWEWKENCCWYFCTLSSLSLGILLNPSIKFSENHTLTETVSNNVLDGTEVTPMILWDLIPAQIQFTKLCMCVLSVQCNKVQWGCPFIIHLHRPATQGTRVTWVTTSVAKHERLILTSCGEKRADLTLCFSHMRTHIDRHWYLPNKLYLLNPNLLTVSDSSKAWFMSLSNSGDHFKCPQKSVQILWKRHVCSLLLQKHDTTHNIFVCVCV